MKRILTLTIFLFAAYCVYAQSCPSGATPIQSGGTCAKNAPAAQSNLLGKPSAGTYSIQCDSSGENCTPVTANGSSTVVPITAPSAILGSQQPNDPISSATPWCDIRAYGANCNGVTPVDSAVSACISSLGAHAGSPAEIFFPGNQSSSQVGGCFWKNPLAAHIPDGTILKGQGVLLLGTTMLIPGVGALSGFAPDGVNLAGGAPGLWNIIGAPCNGTIGTAISSIGSNVNVTPTFTGTEPDGTPCSIANLPPGSAITVAGAFTTTATASRDDAGTTTLTLAAPFRTDVGSAITVTGGTDTTIGINGGTVNAVNYPSQTLAYPQTDVTPTTGTGYTVTAFNDDTYESMVISCSNGVELGGGTATCGTGQITVWASYLHGSSDVWGTVGVTDGGQGAPININGVGIQDSAGMELWLIGNPQATVNNFVSGYQGNLMTSGGVELTGGQVQHWANINLQGSFNPQFNPCPSGGCWPLPYPPALKCDNIGGNSNTGCAGLSITGGGVFGGMIKMGNVGGGFVDGGFGLPSFSDMSWHKTNNINVEIDNRQPIVTISCLSFSRSRTDSSNVVVAYTDSEPATGCDTIENPAGTVADSHFGNSYFNGVVYTPPTPLFTCNAVFVPVGSSAICTFTLTSAQLLQYDGTPATAISEIAAPGPGRMIVLDHLDLGTVNYIAGSTPFGVASAFAVSWGGNSADLFFPVSNVDLSQTTNQVGTGVLAYTGFVGPSAQAVNQPLKIYNDGGTLNGGSIVSSTLDAGGTLWAVSNTFTESNCSTPATGHVTAITGVGTGPISAYVLDTPGVNCTVATGDTLTATSGSGTGASINITAVTHGNGSVQVTIHYTVVAAQ